MGVGVQFIAEENRRREEIMGPGSHTAGAGLGFESRQYDSRDLCGGNLTGV